MAMSITSDCGWLSPEGWWYPCDEEEHRWTAKQLLVSRGPLYEGEDWRRPEEALERRGWCKLRPATMVPAYPRPLRTPGLASWGQGREPTPRQAKALLKWCLGDGVGKTEIPGCLQPEPDEVLP